jgi:hypothetical protein
MNIQWSPSPLLRAWPSNPIARDLEGSEIIYKRGFWWESSRSRIHFVNSSFRDLMSHASIFSKKQMKISDPFQGYTATVPCFDSPKQKTLIRYFRNNILSKFTPKSMLWLRSVRKPLLDVSLVYCGPLIAISLMVVSTFGFCRNNSFHGRNARFRSHNDRGGFIAKPIWCPRTSPPDDKRPTARAFGPFLGIGAVKSLPGHQRIKI